MTARGGSGSEMVIGSSERRERRRKARLDRKHLEPRARRFLKIYLNADETRKPEFYRAVQEASEQCRPSGSSLPPLELEDAQVAEATSSAATQIVLERSALNKIERRGARECNLFIFAPFHLVTPVERVDVLLSIADERELVNVCFRGQPGKHLLSLSFSQFDPYRKSRFLTTGRCHVAKYTGRQLPGSLSALSSRSGVTSSAARAGTALAKPTAATTVASTDARMRGLWFVKRVMIAYLLVDDFVLH